MNEGSKESANRKEEEVMKEGVSACLLREGD